MGLLFNSNQEINEKIKSEFGDLDNHVLAFKHNDVKTDLFKWLVPGLSLIHISEPTRPLF